MRELDLLLLPFVEKTLSSLELERQVLYARLLEEEDQDLFSWLVLRHPAPDDALQSLVDQIRQGDRVTTS